MRKQRQDDSAGLREALRAWKAPKRVPTEHDAPPPSTFPGRKPKLLAGQLDFDGNEVKER